ncbi:hypothetical protein BTR23_05085 [Alkalihalophilus pseudofirmus]|nr:hypothetical protein BTR23_05085 [Alkalihalophilus pseudofirmus]
MKNIPPPNRLMKKWFVLFLKPSCIRVVVLHMNGCRVELNGETQWGTHMKKKGTILSVMNILV